MTRRTSSPFLKSRLRRFRSSSSFSPVTTTSHRPGKTSRRHNPAIHVEVDLEASRERFSRLQVNERLQLLIFANRHTMEDEGPSLPSLEKDLNESRPLHSLFVDEDSNLRDEPLNAALQPLPKFGESRSLRRRQEADQLLRLFEGKVLRGMKLGSEPLQSRRRPLLLLVERHQQIG